ncbi:PIN domain-containing protein [Candidatus Pacearchaeota archaeon]|nr:PIN domain-containing protein [Candidatus Pacearchaeota archaeon]
MNFFLNKIVIDTNILFMAWYNPFGKCGEVLRKANKGEIKIFAPDSVREEIFRVFRREANLMDLEIEEFLFDFEINWVGKNVYEKFLDKVKVKHKPDKPVEATALALNCGILSADNHFKEKINIDELLDSLGED